MPLLSGLHAHIGLTPLGEGVLPIWWFIVLMYVVVLFTSTGHEVSTASFTNQLLAKLMPHLTRAELKKYVLLLRKFGHVLAYGLLTLIVYQACFKTSKKDKLSLLCAVSFSFLVAIFDEHYQRGLPHRTGSWWDVAIDGIGIMLVAGTVWLRVWQKKRILVEVREDVED